MKTTINLTKTEATGLRALLGAAQAGVQEHLGVSSVFDKLNQMQWEGKIDYKYVGDTVDLRMKKAVK